LYIEEKLPKKEKERVKDEDVILIKLYTVSESTSITNLSFADKEVNNLIKYIKFIKSSMQTRLFKLLPHYQLLQSRGEQKPDFWKEIVTALVKNRNNTETSWNGHLIKMFQGGLPHELFFITIDNWKQVIIGPNKKTVVVYMVGELKVLV